MARDTAAIVGGGVMGTGIAQVLAKYDYTVTVREPDQELVEKAEAQLVGGNYGLDDAVESGALTTEERADIRDRITFTTDLAATVADSDFVIEAVTEDLGIKGQVLREIDAHSGDQPIFSNTSGYSVASLANAVADPSRVAVTHFFNPVPVMSLVEIVVGDATAESTLETAKGVVDDLGKTGLVVDDAPGNYGFVANRIYAAMLEEAERVVDEGIATQEQVDTALEEGYNMPVGPFSLARIGEEW